MIYPNYPGRFAAALLAAMVLALAGYLFCRPLRRADAPRPPASGEAGLRLIGVGALTAPRSVAAPLPEWKPELKVPDTPVPPAPELTRELLPPPSAVGKVAALRAPLASGSLVSGRVLEFGPVVPEGGESVKWSLLEASVKPPRAELKKPPMKTGSVVAGVPLPVLAKYLAPRVLPELLTGGGALPPSCPASASAPFLP